MDKKYLDDLQVGDTFSSGEYAITADNIKAFAKEYDPQPFHLDEAAAEGSFFHGLAASGWHTACVTMRLMVDSIPIAGGLIGAGGELRWPQPTRPGDTLHVVAKVLDIKPSRSKPDRGIVIAQIETFNQRDECVQHMQCKMLVFRREAQHE
ncbi:MaoC family dehydratase [Cardiobacteriaceae bacterium TAE3-ERU3]|nr:MaoC family dehydratase [Cardiobacteriaceae bacterium TAE3-ERU3]